MLQQIDSKHLAALESELARVTAQRDALRDALNKCAFVAEAVAHLRGLERELLPHTDAARAALQACQD